MQDQEIILKVNQVFNVSFEIPEEKLLPQMHIFSDLGLDSLDIVDLVVALQEKFNVKLRDDARIRSIQTLGDVHNFILTLKKEGVIKAI